MPNSTGWEMYDLLSKTCQNADPLWHVISLYGQNLLFVPYTGRYGSQTTRFLAYFYAVANACVPFKYGKLCGLNANDA